MWQAVKNIYHLILAFLINVWFGFPAKRLTVIGITGTDGKTTTSHIVYHIFKKAGKKMGMITTVGAQMGDTIYDTGFHTTTPSAIYLQKYLKKMKDEGYTYVMLEVTSHALDQNRVFGIPFKVGVLTNVTHEHLDYHKTYENYLDAKFKLLKKSETCIINKDDRSYNLIKDRLKNKKVVTYSLEDKTSDITFKKFPFKTPLIGEFNKRNCLAAIAIARTFGIKNDLIKEALLTVKPPPGRQEVVYNKDFKVIIDFAHTPHSLDQILPSIVEITTGRVIHVFGAAGERDISKRPLMGRISASFATIVILTSEDPRSESVEKIMDDIAAGIQKPLDSLPLSFQLYKIPDRQEAINLAIALAKKGDTVLITGKGHEQSMNLGNKEELWSEYAAVNKALRIAKK